MNEEELKRRIVSRLNCNAKEHSLGHQARYANRYVLRSADGTRIELMFQKDEKSPPNLWVRKDFVEGILRDRPGGHPLKYKESPKSGLYKEVGKTGNLKYGRHSGLENMPQLGNADLVCFNLRNLDELEYILEALDPVKNRGFLCRIFCGIFCLRAD